MEIKRGKGRYLKRSSIFVDVLPSSKELHFKKIDRKEGTKENLPLFVFIFVFLTDKNNVFRVENRIK